MPPEQTALREMAPDDRLAWFNEHMRKIQSVGLYVVKIDGVCVATGREEEFPLMFQRFGEVIDGPPLVPKTGGMG